MSPIVASAGFLSIVTLGLTACGSGDAPNPAFPTDASVAIEDPFVDSAAPQDASVADTSTRVPSPVDAAPAGPATFTEVYTQILSGPPGCTECHTGAMPTGNLNMTGQSTAYANLVGKPATNAYSCMTQTTDLIAPGSPSTSLLYLKLTKPPCGSQMPLGGPYLSAAQLAVVSSWITDGAKNN